ncbi:MAG TPA: hypothetical protein VHE35_02560 [Kofleriaceae bacterium]|nr:hypothetical protein [Kofleriaceae bacterium]
MTTSTASLDNVIARQRSSRLRDLTFSVMLALGVGLSVGALHAAAATAEATPIARPATVKAPATSVADSMPVPQCEIEQSC